MDAAIALIARGDTPTVNDVAAAADVSRRTVYLYFPSFDQLLIDATVGALSEAPANNSLDHNGDAEKIETRVERLVRSLHHVTPEIERLGRALIRLTVDADARTPGDGMPRRGYRRMEWIESAVSPLRQQIGRAEWRRLVCGLAMVMGWEAMIVQRDVCGLSADEGERLSLWAARALVKAAVAGSRKSRPR